MLAGHTDTVPLDQAYQPDEYLSLDLLEPTGGLLQKLILKYCAAG